MHTEERKVIVRAFVEQAQCRGNLAAIDAFLSPEFVTGNRVAFDVVDVLRVERGQILEHWCVVDRLALLQGVGALPAPVAAS
jgi:predicted ester cyclase